MNWYIAVLKKYAVFSGRARRKEYWFFFLFSVIFSILAGIIDALTGTYDYEAGIGALGIIYTLAMILPGLAVGVRRLHDTDRTGWWVLVAIIPLIGAIVLLVLLCIDGTAGDNKYGPDPKVSDMETLPES